MTLKQFVAICAFIWITVSSLTLYYTLLAAWIAPTHQVTIDVNHLNEMWIEVPLLTFLFFMFIICGLIIIKEEWNK
jgi:glycerol-3-phosphate acyltransferase PlsY